MRTFSQSDLLSKKIHVHIYLHVSGCENSCFCIRDAEVLDSELLKCYHVTRWVLVIIITMIIIIIDCDLDDAH